LLKVIENATNDVTDILQRIRELAVQAASDTNSENDVANLQLEANSLIEEIDRIASDTTYNGVAYLGTGAETVSIQVGYKDGDTIDVTTKNISTTGELLGIAGFDIDGDEALAKVSTAITTVAGFKAAWGAGQNRLEYTVSNLMNVVEFTTAARSRIQDADFAVEAARLAKAQVLQQTGTAMLSQANAAPQLALQLLK
jgi:flagellin